MLTDHQKRVLAAMYALEMQHGHSWWSRSAIGEVVQAGGYHRTIQRKTMHALRDAGLVLREAESFSAETLRLVRCGCACHTWGLTDDGRSLADGMAIHLTKANRRALEQAGIETINFTERGLRDDDDEDDDGWWKRPRSPDLCPA